MTHDTRRRQSGGGGVPARRALPDVKLDLCEMVTAVQLEGLMAGELDLGIARPPVKRPGLVSRPLPHEQLIAALPEAHSMATLGAAAHVEMTPRPGRDHFLAGAG